MEYYGEYISYILHLFQETCTGLAVRGKKIDAAIQTGFRWLLRVIDIHWDSLHCRVSQDIDIKAKYDKQEKEERAKRVQRSRELRFVLI